MKVLIPTGASEIPPNELQPSTLANLERQVRDKGDEGKITRTWFSAEEMTFYVLVEGEGAPSTYAISV